MSTVLWQCLEGAKAFVGWEHLGMQRARTDLVTTAPAKLTWTDRRPVEQGTRHAVVGAVGFRQW